MKKNISLFSLLLLLLLLFLLLIPRNVFASSKPFIQVSPVLFNIVLSPGKTYIYQVHLKNLTDSPLPVSAQFESLESNMDGSELVQKKSTDNVFDIGSWAFLEPADMIIPAQTERTISVKLSLPDKLPLGAYYGRLYLQPRGANEKKINGTVVQSNIGVIFLANIGVPEKAFSAEIRNVEMNALIFSGKPIPLHFNVTNRSLYFFSAKAFATVTPLFGSAKRTEIGEKTILPGKSRIWNNEIESTGLWPGIYKIDTAISVGNGNQIHNQTYFLIVPGVQILFLILVSFLLLFGIQKRKKLLSVLSVMVGKE